MDKSEKGSGNMVEFCWDKKYTCTIERKKETLENKSCRKRGRESFRNSNYLDKRKHVRSRSSVSIICGKRDIYCIVHVQYVDT